MPEYLTLLDHRYSETHYSQKLGDYRSHLSLKPSRVLRAQRLRSAPRACRAARRELRHEIGLENIMWGSDYPHPEGTWPRHARRCSRPSTACPSAEIAAMLGGNAARVYGFDTEKLAPLVARIGPEKRAFQQARRCSAPRRSDPHGPAPLREDASSEVKRAAETNPEFLKSTVRSIRAVYETDPALVGGGDPASRSRRRRAPRSA